MSARCARRRRLGLALAAGLGFVLATPAAAQPRLDPPASGVALLAHDPGRVGPPSSFTLTLDPDGTPVSAFLLNFAADPAGIELVSFTSSHASTFDPVSGRFGAAGAFASDRTAPFEIGSVEAYGLVAGTELVLTAQSNTSDGDLADLPAAPLLVAVVLPELTGSVQLALGALALYAASACSRGVGRGARARSKRAEGAAGSWP